MGAKLRLAGRLASCCRGTVEQNLRGKTAQGVGGGEEEEEEEGGGGGGGRRTGAMAELSKLGDLGEEWGGRERERTVALRARRVLACV